MKEKVLAILQEIKEDVDFSTSASLLGEGLLTSIDIIYLVTELDEAFDIIIPVSEVVPKNFDSVFAICDMIKRIQVE